MGGREEKRGEKGNQERNESGGEERVFATHVSVKKLVFLCVVICWYLAHVYL